MIRVIIEIEELPDGNVATRLASDGVQKGSKRLELITLDLIRDAISRVAGRKVRSFVYTKDLPPSGGNTQQT